MSSSESGWEVRQSRSHGVPYFFNVKTQESTWDSPLPEEALRKLPGAHFLEQLQPPSKQIGAIHLLIKHKDSRRPSSWKEQTITRTKEEAIAILQGLEKEINGAANKSDKFRELANVHSDCSSHDKGGNLGKFSRGQMQKPFEDAAFALDVGDISNIVSTDSGVHLIMRTE